MSQPRFFLLPWLCAVLLPTLTACLGIVQETGDPGNPTSACAADQHLQSGACVPNQRSCDLDNGIGTERWMTDRWGACSLRSCNDGYHAENNFCTLSSRACDVDNGSGTQNWNDGAWSDCTVVSCAAGHHEEDGTCASNERSCEISDGTGVQAWTGDWGDCTVLRCDDGHHEENGRCFSDTRSCDAGGEAGEQFWSNGLWSDCVVAQCDPGYEPVGDTCQLGACTDMRDWVSIPVRFHLLRSQIEGLNATLSETELLQIIDEAQTYLDQACIHIDVESIIEAPLSTAQEDAYAAAWINPAAVAPEMLKPIMIAAMPTNHLLSPGWNVMVLKHFNKYASGVYLSEIPSVLWAEQIPPAGGGAPNPSVILAHELGHALGLLHYEGADVASNLMCESVYQNRNTADELTASQVETAYAQASSGQTYLPSGPGGNEPPTLDMRIGEILDERVPAVVEASGSPGKAIGLVVGVSFPGARVFRSYGAALRNGNVPPATDSIFEIGSVTKVVTGYLMARGVANGDLQPTQPISMYFGAGVPSFSSVPIRLIHLATHRSGLPNFPDNLVSVGTATPGAGYTQALLQEFLAGYTLTRAPGTEYEYSNLGSGMLGQACVDAAGVDGYEALVQREVALPLGLADFRVELAPSQLTRKIQGYAMGTAAPEMELGAPLQGAGALQATAADLLTFLEAGLDGNDPAWELVKTPRAEMPVAANAQIGLQIAIESPPGEPTMYSKSGNTPGFTSQIVFTTEPPIAVVLLSNTANTQGLLPLGKELIAAIEAIGAIP